MKRKYNSTFIIQFIFFFVMVDLSSRTCYERKAKGLGEVKKFQDVIISCRWFCGFYRLIFFVFELYLSD